MNAARTAGKAKWLRELMGFDRFVSDEELHRLLVSMWEQQVLPSLYDLELVAGLPAERIHVKICRLEHKGRLEQMCGCGECNGSICPPGWTDGAGYPEPQPEILLITDHEPDTTSDPVICFICGAPIAAHSWGSFPPEGGVGSWGNLPMDGVHRFCPVTDLPCVFDQCADKCAHE